MVPTKTQLITENEELKLRLAQLEAALDERANPIEALAPPPATTNLQPDSIPTKKRLDESAQNLAKALLESETRFKAITEALPIAVGISEQDGTFLYINQTYERLFGYSINELLPLNANELYKDARDRLAWLDIYHEKGRLQDYEVELKRNDGTVFWALISVSPIRYDGRQAILGSVMDIDARKRLEIAQSESEQLYSAVFDRSPYALSLTRMPDGKLVNVNDAFLKLFGFTQEEVIGKTGQELGITSLESRRQIAQEFQKSGFVTDFECSHSNKTGEELILSLNLDWVTFGGEKLVLTTIRDITISKRTEQALAELHLVAENEHKRLLAIMEALPVGVAILDSHGGNIQGNRAYEQVWGDPRPVVDSISDYSAYKAWWVDNGEPVQPEEWASAQAVQKGISVTGQVMKIQRFDGTFAYVHNSGAPIFDQNGVVIGCAVAIQDITELKSHEDEIRQLNRTLKALSNSNQAMLRAASEQEYLDDVCRIIIQDCGFKMVWIGYAENDRQKSVQPVASAGFEEGYLEKLKITWADKERGRGPTGTAIRTGKPSRCNNMLTDPKFTPWREAALQRGYASSIVLPLKLGDRSFGALNIYSTEPYGFSDEEEKLLVELAADLSFGIATLRLKADHAHAEAALRQSESRYRTLFDNMTEGFALHEIVCDEAGQPCDYRYLEINPSFERMTGLQRHKVIGRLASQVLPSLEPFLIHTYGEVALTGQPLEFDYHPEELGRYFRVYAFSPAPAQFAAIFMDITEAKHAEVEIQRSEAMLRTVLNQMPSGVTVRDAKTGELVLANNQSLSIMGILADDSTQFSFYRGRHPDGRVYTREEWPIQRSLATGEVVNAEEINYERSDGSRVILSVSSAPVRDSLGNIILGAGVIQDITERKRAEDRLAYLASFPERNPNPLVEVDLSGQVRYANPAVQTLFPDLVERGTAHPWLADWDLIVRSFHQGKSGLITRDVPVGDHYYQEALSYITPGDLIRIYGLDITDRKLAEQALLKARDELEQRVQERTQELNLANNQLRLEVLERKKTSEELQSNIQELQVIEEELRSNNEMLIEAQKVLDEEKQRYQGLFDFAPDGYLVTDKNGVIREANQVATKLLEISHQNLIGKPLLIFISPSDHHIFTHLIATLGWKHEIQSQELKIKPRKGPEIYVAVTIAYVKARNNRDTLRWTVRDITERKKSEELIQQNYLRNTVLSEVSQSLTEASLDEQAILDLVVKTTARLVGDCSVITLVSEDGQFLEPVAWYHNQPESHRLMTEIYASTRHSVNDDLSGQVFRTSKPVLIPTVNPPSQADLDSNPFRAFYEKVGISSLLIVPLQIGAQTIGTFGLARGSAGKPFTPEDQTLLEMLANRTAQSIHNARLYQELQNAMRKELEVHDQLVQAEKFAVVGRLLASITHEINNPLQTVKNCLYLLQVDIPADSQAADALSMAVTETNRLSNLVAQLREVYRPPVIGKSEVVHLPDLIGEVHSLLASYLQEKRVTWVSTLTEPGLFARLKVEAIPDQLKQVFLNVCLNAVDAMEPNGGSIMINNKLSEDASQVGICIKDTGPGLAPEVKARLFEPFLTTKEKGLGLGLAICYDIILRHSGHIEVDSESGEGAAFTIWLPVLKEDG